MRPSVVVVGLLAGAWVFTAPPAGAQSIKDTVRQHVTEGLDASRSEPKKKKAAKKRRSGEERATPPTQQTVPAPPPARDVAPAAEPVPAQPVQTPPVPAQPRSARAPRPRAPRSTRAASPASAAHDAAISAPSVASEERLPLRVFGKNLELDAKVGAGMRGWYPEQYPLVSVDHASYLTWSVDLKAKILGFLRLHRGYYESNGLRGPRTRVQWWRATSVSSCPRQHGCSAPWVFH